MTNREKATYFIEHGGYVSVTSIGEAEAAAIRKFAEWLDRKEQDELENKA